MKQQMNKNHTITHVNIRARICFPEGSLSRFVARVQSLESIGRYGILIWNKERQKICISVQLTSSEEILFIREPISSVQGATNSTLFRRAAGASFSDASKASASILLGASLPSSTTSSLLMLIP